MKCTATDKNRNSREKELTLNSVFSGHLGLAVNTEALMNYDVNAKLPGIQVDAAAYKANKITVTGLINKEFIKNGIVVTVNKKKATIDENGKFTAEKVSLKAGKNTLTINATVKSLGLEDTETVTLVLEEDKAPKVKILLPKKDVCTNSDTHEMVVSGTVSEEARVELYVNGYLEDEAVTSGKKNTFELDVELPDGAFTILVKAYDTSGNSSRADDDFSFNKADCRKIIIDGAAPEIKNFKVLTAEKAPREITGETTDYGKILLTGSIKDLIKENIFDDEGEGDDTTGIDSNYTYKDYTVFLTVNDDPKAKKIKLKKDGTFSIKYSLRDGVPTKLSLTVVDKAGNYSKVAQVVTLTYNKPGKK